MVEEINSDPFRRHHLDRGPDRIHLQAQALPREAARDRHRHEVLSRIALRHVLRQDPDVILISEMRDLETISAAITAAETGHLVLATLHTIDAPKAVDRIVDAFPARQQQAQIIAQLANALQAIIAQRLLPRADGKGRVGLRARS